MVVGREQTRETRKAATSDRDGVDDGGPDRRRDRKTSRGVEAVEGFLSIPPAGSWTAAGSVALALPCGLDSDAGRYWRKVSRVPDPSGGRRGAVIGGWSLS